MRVVKTPVGLLFLDKEIMITKLLTAAIVVSVITVGASACSSPATEDNAAETIVVGTEGTYAPFSFHDTASNELTGYDVEVIKAVAKEAGYNVEFAETPWDSIFAGLEAGRFDVIANQVTINDERTAQYTFSEPYTISQEVAVTLADSNKVTSTSDLTGLTAAQSATSNYHDDAVAAGAKIEQVPGLTEALALVTSQRVDLTLNDRLSVLDYLTQNPNSGLKIAAESADKSSQAFVFTKDSKFAKPINEALKKLLANGEIAKISEKYFGEDVTK